MPDPGDVVLVEFPGVVATKRRPAVVVSTAAYHVARPDMVIGLITSQVAKASTTFDHTIADWSAAGLLKPSAFRAYLWTVPRVLRTVVVGHMSDGDFRAVRDCVRIAVSP